MLAKKPHINVHEPKRGSRDPACYRTAMAITRLTRFHAQADKAEALRELLRSVVALIEAAPGCRSCALLGQHDDASRMVVVEVWDSVQAHQASVSGIPPEKLKESQRLLAEPPAGTYYDPL
jgi:quinol monooxygenase YgiN